MDAKVRQKTLRAFSFNPTPNNVASVTLPEACQAIPNPCRQLTHDNLLSPPSGLPAVTAIPLSGHNAAVILKM